MVTHLERAMNTPDGLEQRTADLEERYAADDESFDLAELLADEYEVRDDE